VNGVAEHTPLLQSAVEHSKERTHCFVITWRDLRNAFGSIPHDHLQQMFESLLIPGHMRTIMLDIYSDNVMNFAVNDEDDRLPGCARRCAQYDGLRRVAKAEATPGYDCFGEKIKAFDNVIAFIT
jgi:hypothetical protein